MKKKLSDAEREKIQKKLSEYNDQRLKLMGRDIDEFDRNQMLRGCLGPLGPLLGYIVSAIFRKRR